MLMAGKTLESRFEIIEQIGEGGMARVYLCQDKETNERVAAKIVTISPAQQGFIRKRFKREFTLTKRVNHPNVVTLHHFGTLDDCTLYTVMEYIEGQDLQQLIDDNEVIPQKQVKEIAIKMAKALLAMHKEGIIHRDLKPANVMMKSATEPVIMDFGLARALDLTQMTATGTIMGTPVYMAPEQTQSSTVDHRSDIYQLGTILFHLLTGQLPFGGYSIAEILAKIVHQRPPLVTTINSEVSPKWNPLIETCLQKDPDLRFQKTDALVASLEKLKLREDSVSVESTPINGQSLPAEQQVSVEQLVDTGQEASVENRGDPKKDARAKKTEVVRKNVAVPHRAVPFYCFIVIVIVVGLLCLYPTVRESDDAGKAYGVLELNAEPSFNTVTISWRSNVAYPSRIVLHGEKEMIVEDRDKKLKRVHKIKINGLHENRPYQFSVLFPNGKRSFKQKVATDRFRLELLESLVSSENLLLKLQVAPVPLNATCQTTPRHVAASSRLTDDGLLTVTIEGPYWELSDVGIEAQYENDIFRKETLKELLQSLCKFLISDLKSVHRQTLLDRFERVSAIAPGQY